MKRIAAPKVKYYRDMGSDYSRVIRENYPADWLLSELLLHTINLCLNAFETVSTRMLLDSILTLRDSETNADAFFNETYRIARGKNHVIYHEYVKSLTPEERAIKDASVWLAMRDESIPQYQVWIDVGNFILGEYRHLPLEYRTVTDLAFQGFLFNTLNGPDFASLCKNTALLVPAMTFEQKLDEELDHETLHNRLMAQLGHA